MNQREPQYEDFKIPGHDVTVPIMLLHGKQYLQVQQRIVWFNLEKQDWTIETRIEAEGKDPEGMPVWVRFLCEIRNPSGRLLRTARKTKNITSEKDFESCETGSIGRALSLMGYGTAYSEDMSEDNEVVDSPQPSIKPAPFKKEEKLSTFDLANTVASDGVFINKTLQDIFKIDEAAAFKWTIALDKQMKEGAKLQSWKLKYLTYANDMGIQI